MVGYTSIVGSETSWESSRYNLYCECIEVEKAEVPLEIDQKSVQRLYVAFLHFPPEFMKKL